MAGKTHIGEVRKMDQGQAALIKIIRAHTDAINSLTVRIVELENQMKEKST